MTAITRIVDWINEDGRPTWRRHTIRLLLEGYKLEEIHYDLLYNIARKEAGFNEELPLFDSYAELVSSDGFEMEEEPVFLLKLGPVNNISSLRDE
ncbi:MAG: hypothetical protein JRI32_09210, partial [Deltaproteobacteria bacterium]|nr:hypothetical protein [Deltaproteobacteria bacterium]